MPRRTRTRIKKKKDFFDTHSYESYQKQPAICPHFGTCGGCRFQDISYQDQLIIKESYLKNVFNREINVHKADNQLYYRNRMDFVYFKGNLGLRKRGDFREVVDIQECHLLPEFVRPVYNKIRVLLKKYDIPSYDYIEHEGFLRYITFRIAPSTKEIMIICNSTTPPTDELKQTFFSFLDELKQDVTSLYWFWYDDITDVSIPPIQPHSIYGKETITEQIGHISLSYSPYSFFQANTEVSKTMFDKISEYVSGSTVDVCCGVGSITLFVANKTSTIMGVEEVQASIDVANQNKQQNNVDSVRFFCQGMKDIRDIVPMEIDTIILDPPRGGLGNKVVQRTLELDAEIIIYMSCNPKTQKTDLDIFLASEKYELIYLEGFDMFPQTSHLETLAILRKRQE